MARKASAMDGIPSIAPHLPERLDKWREKSTIHNNAPDVQTFGAFYKKNGLRSTPTQLFPTLYKTSQAKESKLGLESEHSRE